MVRQCRVLPRVTNKRRGFESSKFRFHTMDMVDLVSLDHIIHNYRSTGHGKLKLEENEKLGSGSRNDTACVSGAASLDLTAAVTK